jgi:hypothetical protein
MSDLKAVFLIGNKRSGTSHFVRLLNLHPEVFVTHESDVIWILYQMAHRLPFRCYPWDGPRGMEATLEACTGIIREESKDLSDEGAVAGLFHRIEQWLMQRGSKVQEPYNKRALAWEGDKKPVQQADPRIVSFILHHFPTARFIHVIRHPQMTVSSMVAAGRTRAKVEYWKAPPDVILERWAIHEEWVLAVKAQGAPVFSLRFEDLCANPAAGMAQVFEFLGLTLPQEITTDLQGLTRQDENRKHESFRLPCSERAEKVMEHYGYRRAPA